MPARDSGSSISPSVDGGNAGLQIEIAWVGRLRRHGNRVPVRRGVAVVEASAGAAARLDQPVHQKLGAAQTVAVDHRVQTLQPPSAQRWLMTVSAGRCDLGRLTLKSASLR